MIIRHLLILASDLHRSPASANYSSQSLPSIASNACPFSEVNFKSSPHGGLFLFQCGPYTPLSQLNFALSLLRHTSRINFSFVNDRAHYPSSQYGHSHLNPTALVSTFPTVCSLPHTTFATERRIIYTIFTSSNSLQVTASCVPPHRERRNI